MELSAVRFEVDGHVGTVWLDRPHRHNAWTGRMHSEYRSAPGRARRGPGGSCGRGHRHPTSVLRRRRQRGVGRSRRTRRVRQRAADDRAVARPGYGVRAEFDHDFSFQFGLRFPMIAAVNGACAGVGLAVALFCDLRFGAAGARCTTAAPKLGLPAEYGMSWMLPRLVGVTRATDLLLSGRVFTAGRDRRVGHLERCRGRRRGRADRRARLRTSAQHLGRTRTPSRRPRRRSTATSCATTSARRSTTRSGCSARRPRPPSTARAWPPSARSVLRTSEQPARSRNVRTGTMHEFTIWGDCDDHRCRSGRFRRRQHHCQL